MQAGNRVKMWARTVLVLAAVLLAVAQFRGSSTGFDLAINERGLQFELKSAFIRLAFDIGQQRPIPNSVGRLV